MPPLVARAAAFLRLPSLPFEARRTFRFHLAYALLDAAAGGILLNAPMVAIRAMHGESWQLPLRQLFSGIGMLAALYLGSWMARRQKMPFVFVPGLLCGLSTLAMSLAGADALWFLTCFGISAMFEIVTRPATTAILRIKYPATCRGHATGEVRKWSSLVFVAANLQCAWLLQRWGEHAIDAVPILIATAGVLSLASFACFRMIRVDEETATAEPGSGLEIGKHLRDAVEVLRDDRYRRYLLGCFVDGFCGMLYFPLIWAFLRDALRYDYVGCAALMHTVPALTAFVVTGWLGQWFDRSNPWVSWAWIRFAWGLDALLLAATPFAAGYLPAAVLLLPVAGRLLRGSVQGGQWVLWWQVGVTHFAPPGQDTTRYAGIMVFLNGAIRIVASGAGIVLTAMHVQPVTLMVLGGSGVILSGVYSLWQARRERREHRPETVAEFESQFGDRYSSRPV